MKREQEKVYLYGKHALSEALLNASHVIRKVFFAPEMRDRELSDLVRKLNIPVTVMKGKEADRMVGGDSTHQGVIAIADIGALMVDFSDFMARATFSNDTMLVLLDELTDPHNVGAIIRSAAAFGAAGVLVPTHNQAPITGSVVKTSAGMVFRLPIISIGNVNQTIIALQKEGFRAYALTADGSKKLTVEKFDAPSVFVVGNEGKGIRQKTFEHCDETLSIPIDPRCESLNASVSAAVVFYEWAKHHPNVLKRI
jgi:23S rRNA (guanosine2251-2'-O)-methyltransferase